MWQVIQRSNIKWSEAGVKLSQLSAFISVIEAHSITLALDKESEEKENAMEDTYPSLTYIFHD